MTDPDRYHLAQINIAHLRRHWPAAEAFTIKQRYPAPRSLAA
jgi:hypothetical protein